MSVWYRTFNVATALGNGLPSPPEQRIVRVQRQRTKGWRMPEGAVYVGRPTRWGNGILPTMLDFHDQPLGVERAVDLYRLATLRFIEDGPPGAVAAWLAPLRKATALACWCPLYDQYGRRTTCHADVLIDIVAGAPVPA